MSPTTLTTKVNQIILTKIKVFEKGLVCISLSRLPHDNPSTVDEGASTTSSTCLINSGKFMSSFSKHNFNYTSVVDDKHPTYFII